MSQKVKAKLEIILLTVFIPLTQKRIAKLVLKEQVAEYVNCTGCQP